MASTSPTLDFPQFPDGDVAILVSTSKIYKLHSHVLRRASASFRNVFDTTPAPKLTAAARRDGHTPWRFVLFEDPSLANSTGQFAALQISESGRVFNSIAPRAARNTIGGEDEDKCWDWLFGAFYGVTPTFDGSSFAATLNGCFALLEVAESIGAVEQVREIVDLALMRQDEVLWRSIACNPTVWAELGRRVRSPTIFKEAVVHIVGQWKMLDDEVKESLPADIFELCRRKWNELELAKRAIEIRIAGHYPAFLCRNHADKPQRSAYASDIYMWMALAFFRQYISQSGNDGKNRLADDGGYSWYKQISVGGSEYLNRQDMSTFHQFFPMSGKACGVMEAHMNVLKEEAKPFVKDLMVVRTHVDPATMTERPGKPWLTCTVVEKEDLPWHVPDDIGEDARLQSAELEDAGAFADDEDAG